MIPFASRVRTALRHLDIVFLVVAVALFVGTVCRLFNNVEDDAFIPMRYGLNFWRGAGWVMNPGEHVEGCTSPLHLVLVTSLLRFCSPGQTLWAQKILGIGIGAAVLVLTWRIGRHLLPRRWVAGVIPLLIASRPEFALSMTNGLETGLATLLVTEGVAALLTAGRGEDVDLRPSAWLFLGAALARPELALTFPLLFLLLMPRGGPRREGWVALACYCLPLLLGLGLRWLYYGALVPNTYWAKHLPPDIAFAMGLHYLEYFDLFGIPWLSLFFYGIGCLVLVRRQGPERIVLPVVIGLHLLFLLRSGGDWMVDGRFYVIMLPLCAVLWGVALDFLWRLAVRAPAGAGAGHRVAAPLLAGILAAGLAAELGGVSEHSAARLASLAGMHSLTASLRTHAPLEEWRCGNHEGRLAVGRWVAAHARPGQTVLSSEMGLATVTNPTVRFLDIRGLTDSKIARMSDCPREINGIQGERLWMADTQPLGRYLHGRRPEWVALVWNVYRGDLNGAGNSSDLYVPAGLFPIYCDGRWLTVATWRRRDIPNEAFASCHN